MTENSKRLWYLAVILFAGWVVIRVDGQQPAKPVSKMVRWEYRVLASPPKLDERQMLYASLGQEGWEYAAQERDQFSGLAVFKRPIPGP